jgi:hypothetical protein
MPERLRSWLLVVPILLLAAGLRLVAPELDPPPDVTGGPSPNEGLYLLNARHLAVAGQLRLDDWNAAILHPIGSRLHAAGFEGLGTSLVTARRVTAAVALLGILLFHVLLRRAGGAGTALLATLFLAVNGMHVVHSRVAGPAPLAITLMFLTIALWEAGRQRVWLVPLAGAALALSAVVENGPHNLFFLATALLATLMVRLQAWKMPWAAATRRRIRLFWGAALVTLVGWYVILVRPEQSDLVRMMSTPLGDLRLGHIAQNLFMAPFNFWQMIQWIPALTGIALLYLLVFARDLMAPIARHRAVAEVRIWFFAWLITAPIYFAVRWDRSLGVLVLLVPPLCVAAAEALAAVLRLTQVRKPQLDIMVVLGLITLVIGTTVQAAVHSFVMLRHDDIPAGFFNHQFRYESLIVALVAIPLILLASHAWLRWKKFTLAVSPVVALGLFALGVTLVLASDAWIGRAILRGRPDIVTAGRGASALPAGSVLAGSWAPVLSLDSGHRGLVVWSGMNDHRPVATYGITHLALQQPSREGPDTNAGFRDEAAEVLARMRFVGDWPVGRVKVAVYALDGGASRDGDGDDKGNSGAPR